MQTAAVDVAVRRTAAIRRLRRDGHGCPKSGHPMTVLTADLTYSEIAHVNERGEHEVVVADVAVERL
jgi:hypothetical protein